MRVDEQLQHLFCYTYLAKLDQSTKAATLAPSLYYVALELSLAIPLPVTTR